MKPFALLAGMVATCTIADHADAQRRDPPLSQVRVPHAYYWREMYVPQVTSGPSAFAWSPDGRDVIYSMQGSLWRQHLGTTTATQLTSGETYDFQPDWSPSGRSLVYSAYDGRSLKLMLLDLPTGESRPLVDNGAVNVEPRWSPDGARIAFVSSAHEGRWHIFIARVAGSRVDSLTRVTEDRDSGLPRYYYSRFDHYLSPTWSPDGRELIFVSNRGRMYGTGGLWRMETRAGATPREIHYEETTWKARPDWSRDGKRVVYSGYHGRQWNQLWLAPSERGDPIQLTYGEFDATAPRWSPDATRIGYVSNESGNTSLWIVTIPGGQRERVVARTRRYREPMGRIVVAVTDSATRRRIPARVSVRVASKSFAPDERWRHADEAILRDGERFEYGYWHSSGIDTLTVPAGRAVVQVWRGPEWRSTTRVVTVRPERATAVNVRMTRLANLPATGWWGGDVHVHMNYGGAYRNTPAQLALQARAEGLHVVHNLVVNKEQRIPDIAYWRTGLLHSAPDLIIANGQEFHTGIWGHTSQLGLRDHYLLPDYAAYPGTALASLFPTNAHVADLARQQGALTGYVHPLDFRPDLSQFQGGVPYELPIDVALGKVDFLEVMGYSDHRITSEIWFRLLNCGFRVPAAAGTDAFPNFASLRGPPGLVRTYAKAGPRLDHRAWLSALKAGRTFVTNGPLISLTVNGREPGDELRLPFGGGTHRVRARVTVLTHVPVNHVDIVSNGRVVARLMDAREPRIVRIDTTVMLRIDRDAWFVARAYSDHPRLPVLDLYPFATTSPVYAKIGTAQPTCREDADYFLTWIGLIRERVRNDTSWNSPAERDATLNAISRAHEEFIRRR
jgi:TolB protein